jgi:hypothetical protein
VNITDIEVTRSAFLNNTRTCVYCLQIKHVANDVLTLLFSFKMPLKPDKQSERWLQHKRVTILNIISRCMFTHRLNKRVRRSPTEVIGMCTSNVHK